MTFDIDNVLAQLTTEEKASLTSGSGFWWTVPIDRLGVPRIMVSDGPHGLRAQPGEGDHLGIGNSLPATCFPTASAIASSWNPALLHRVGQALGQEARAVRLSVILGPGINMKRSPLCGRNFEYFSEDPYLAGELAVGIVDGIQSKGVGTSVKHYAANNQETERLRVDTQVDERTLREIYLPAFERVVKASQPWTIMASYNKVNGTSATEHGWLLQDILRDEFGFKGLVVSDWGAVYNRVPALNAGTDLEMPPNPASPDKVAKAVAAGEISMATLNARARTVLELVAKGQHVLDLDEDFDQDAHHALAREAAAESAVLLKNDDILPLRQGASIGIVGEFARTPRFQGAGSSQVNPTRLTNVVDELQASFPDAPFAAGYGINTTDGDDALRSQAVGLAKSVDTVVMLLGLPDSDESEGFDRQHMRLPDNQLTTLAAVAAANANVVVVLVNGSTVELDQVTPHAKGLVEAWLGGQAAAGGIADVLTGTVNPSGKLAETMPHRLADNSSYLNFPGDSLIVRYGEGLYIGYRGYDKAEQDVAFPFGFGLSYTSFELSDLQVTSTGSVEDSNLAATVTLTVTNTGPVAGAEVVQVYVADLESSVGRPVREMKGFTKVALQPGESKQVSVELDQRAFSFWSDRFSQWTVEAGEFAIEVGTSSRDLPLRQTISVDAPTLTPPLTASSSLEEWAADPDGLRLIQEAVANGQDDPLRDPELVTVLGNFPMNALSSFSGMSIDLTTLEQMVDDWNGANRR